jgi:hypothetical protein
MTTHQRHLYRALLLAALWCPTRPDLPNDDNELYLLADADDVADWQKNKAPILTKLHEDEVDGVKVLYNNRLRKEWAVFEEAHDKWQGQAEAKKSKLSARAKKGADARWKNAKDASSIAPDATGTLGMPLKDTETKPTENSHSNQKREQPEPNPAGAQASGSGSPANASHSTNPSDSGSGFSAQDRAEVDRLLGNTPATTMAEQAEAKKNLCVLVDTIFGDPVDRADITSLLRRDNPQIVLDIIRWAWEKSDYWFKKEKGMVKNPAALYNAYPPMKQSYLSYWQTAKDRLDAKKKKKNGSAPVFSDEEAALKRGDTL